MRNVAYLVIVGSVDRRPDQIVLGEVFGSEPFVCDVVQLRLLPP